MPGGLKERIALVGPTASGKTAVGIHLVARLGAEIVSADSMQVYRQMDIGTAKPTPDEQRSAVFHAINVADPNQDWTLADYQRLGDAACLDIAARGHIPLIVGGTGLYVRALTTLLDIPVAPPDEAFRAKWREFAETNGNAALLAEVARIDLDTAARLHVNDIGRQIRALEVYSATGQTLTELHTENRARQSEEAPLLFGLAFADRERLYERIDSRVDQMLQDGLLDEVRGLRERGYSAALKPMQSLGYRHITAFLAGEMDWETSVAAIKQDTRRFAKRQMIWFRGDKRVQWVTADGKPAQQLADEIFELIAMQQQQRQGDHAPQ
ncbi:MAG: tRNA (adenosine(37)-N6)-dimethylallyltransferase MiaA [Armatimonadota bacterium]|nr:tRNA (adenosine(37)-N6)-dimethylallyltransferase MiaA [Armatimonadota bacterium]